MNFCKYFVTLLFCLLPYLAYTQQREFIAGVFFNANGIEIVGENDIFWQSVNGKIWGGGGVSAGMEVKMPLKKRLDLGIEIRYIQKGSTYEYINQFGMQSYEVLRLNYIEIPIMLGYTFYVNKKDYTFSTGPGFARRFSSKMKIDEFMQRNNGTDVDSFKYFDFSWISSFSFPLNRKGKRNLLFGMRYSYSLLSIHENYKLRNMVYGIQLNYLFVN